MEDEEYVPENSDLRCYLESLNLFDVSKESTTKEGVYNSSVQYELKSKSKNEVDCVDKDIIEQIELLLSARMLFEEDVANIEKLLSNFKVIKIGMLRSIFENVSGFIIIVLGLCVYWVIGSYVFFMISVYYAYNAADYLWRKHFNQKRLKNLIEVLKANYILFKKTLKFINDSDNILEINVKDKLYTPKNLTDNCELYLNLKKEFAAAESEVISILINATKKLINKLPFYSYVENPQCYLCNRYEQHFLECIDVSKLYQVYLLVQSEFLQRLALSLIPNLQISGKGNCIELNKVIKETSIVMRQLENKFSKKFKFVFLRGVYCKEKTSNLNLSKDPTADLREQYRNEFISNIQDMSNSFQRLLIRSRTIENYFPVENCPEKVENELADIQNELKLCEKNLNDSFIILKKFYRKPQTAEKFLKEDCVEEAIVPEESQKILLHGENEKVQDEIYEAYLSSECTNETEEEGYDYEDNLKKKMERVYSNTVLAELKTKILTKAKDWEAREANAVKKVIGNEGPKDRTNGNDAVGRSESGVSHPHIGKSAEVESRAHDEDGSSASETHLPFNVPNSNFLMDIFEARRKLIQAQTPEEYFVCDTGEDSDE